MDQEMIGRQLAHYRIVAKLGAGGMGEVYAAEDGKLGRRVAIKVLPSAFSDDADRLARFEREARALAQLNHPNIASIYGLEEAEGIRFLVLELVDGETLQERIARGPVPVEEALGMARQIAAGLGEAHASGILHRDLKPANVKVTPDGKVKILDFGLAKPFQPDPVSGDPALSQSPTMTFGSTQAGMILGTAAYMSPEQARGHAIDRRSDIWAFGVVLFEMLTGAQAFRGDTVSDILASILKEDPAWSRLPPLPPAATRLIRRSLARDPASRLHDIGDARLEIDEALQGGTAGGEVAVTAPEPPVRRRLPWAVAALAVLAAAWIAYVAVGRRGTEPTRVEASIVPPEGVGFDVTSGGLALSPDGSRLAFIGRREDGSSRIWIRPLSRNESRPLEGTAGVRSLFFSPDGRQLAFYAGRLLKKIDIETGLVENLAPVDDLTRGGSWGAGGDILMRTAWSQGLHRIPETGGTPEPVTVPEASGVDYHGWPWFLPDGRHFLYHVRTYAADQEMGELRLGALDGSVSRVLFPSNSNAVYVPPGFLLWWHEGNLRAQRFDAGALSLEGEPFPVAPQVRFDPRNGYGVFAASANGILLYQTGSEVGGDQLVWMSRDGQEIGTVGKPGSLYSPDLSPDGKLVALDISGQTNQGDIWVLDVARNTGTRFSVFPEDDSQPAWSPDGRRIAFFSMKGGGFAEIYVRSLRGGEPERLLGDPEANLNPVSWHGDTLLIDREGESTDIWGYSMDDGRFVPYQATPFAEWSGTFSPDGRYVAFVSEESGQWEVYVQPFPDPTGRWPVSAGGGWMPVWRKDGGELFYLSPEKEIVAVEVRLPPAGSDAEPEFGVPQPLFRVDIKEHASTQFDTIDGQRFLVNRAVRVGLRDPLTLVVHWPRELAP